MNAIFPFLARQPYHRKYILNDIFIINFHVAVKEYLRVLNLDYTVVAVSGKVRPVKPVNHISRMAVVTPADRPVGPQSLCNRTFL